MSNIELFNFEENQVRVIEIDSSYWFVAKDVCAVLGLQDTSSATRRLDDDEKYLITDISQLTALDAGSHDVLKKEMDTMIENNINTKELSPQLSRKAKEFYINKLG